MRRDISGWMVRWDAARAARLKAEGAWLDKTIADHLDEIVAATPRKVLVTDGARDVTAQALQRRARRLAQALVPARVPSGRHAVVPASELGRGGGDQPRRGNGRSGGEPDRADLSRQRGGLHAGRQPRAADLHSRHLPQARLPRDDGGTAARPARGFRGRRGARRGRRPRRLRDASGRGTGRHAAAGRRPGCGEDDHVYLGDDRARQGRAAQPQHAAGREPLPADPSRAHPRRHHVQPLARHPRDRARSTRSASPSLAACAR